MRKNAIMFLVLILSLPLQVLLAGQDKYMEYYQKGNVHLKNKMYTQAIQEYEKSIQENPRFPQAYLNMGICYDQFLHNNGKAIENYIKYIQNGGVKVDEVKKWISSIANLRYITTDVEYARLKKAVEFYNNGVELSKKARYLTAIESFKQAIEIVPYYVKAHYIIGMAYFTTKQYGSAYEHFMKVILYDPDNPTLAQVYYYLGLLYDDVLIKDFGTALEFYRQYKKRDGSKNVDNLINSLEGLESILARAQSLYNEKKYPQAIAVLEKGLKVKNDDVRLYNNIAVNYLKLKEYQKTEDYLNKALSIRADAGETYYNLACLYSLTGAGEKAFDFFKEGIKFYPRNVLENSLSDEDLKNLRKEKGFLSTVNSNLK
ncbi:MAG: tetratricopeptide repeat protein [bacterium]|nr:tetratricopeptide repeat protein [bacterium]